MLLRSALRACCNWLYGQYEIECDEDYFSYNADDQSVKLTEEDVTVNGTFNGFSVVDCEIHIHIKGRQCKYHRIKFESD